MRDFWTDENLDLDPQMNYNIVEGLSAELKERLSMHKPSNIVGLHRSLSSPVLKVICRGLQNGWRV